LDSPNRNQQEKDNSSTHINPDAAGAGIERIRNKRKGLPTERFVEHIMAGDRTMLSRAITLIESTRPDDQQKAQQIIEECLPAAGRSVRIGVTGIPGVGKSTFIEELGSHVIDQGHKLAVLAIDPTSSKSHGSILGDKTRMGSLANNDHAFIRPSPTSGSLGGVARKTRETILLCEAAGFDTIFVETVGVGQSEIVVHSMVDFFLLLMIAGAGDELQGIKRGIVEMADAIAINKADGDNKRAAQRAASEYKRALHLYPPAESQWQPKVKTCSALTGDGIEAIWAMISDYLSLTKENGYFAANRKRQAVHWMQEMIEEHLKTRFYQNSAVQDHLETTEKQVAGGEITSYKAAQKLLNLFEEKENR